MEDLFLWISGLLGDMPGLSWFKYIIVGIILLVVVDLILSMLISAVASLIGGGRR